MAGPARLCRGDQHDRRQPHGDLQSSLKRLLAYSGIAQAGYVLIGVLGSQARGLAAVLFYLFVYMFMNFGAFAVLIVMARPDGRPRPLHGPGRTRAGATRLMAGS